MLKDLSKQAVTVDNLLEAEEIMNKLIENIIGREFEDFAELENEIIIEVATEQELIVSKVNDEVINIYENAERSAVVGLYYYSTDDTKIYADSVEVYTDREDISALESLKIQRNLIGRQWKFLPDVLKEQFLNSMYAYINVNGMEVSQADADYCIIDLNDILSIDGCSSIIGFEPCPNAEIYCPFGSAYIDELITEAEEVL